MKSEDWRVMAGWCGVGLILAGCVDERKSSEHTIFGTGETERTTQGLPSLPPPPYPGAESASVAPRAPRPSELAATAAGTLADLGSARTSTPSSTSTSALVEGSPATLNVPPDVYEQLTHAAVEWRGTLSGWGKHLTFPAEGRPERLLDGQGGSMRLLTASPTSLWVERRWDGGGIDVHHFESSALPEGWKLYFVDNVTKIYVEDPMLNGKWHGLALSKWPEGFVERFLEAWPINVKEGVAFRPLTDELFPVVFIGNARMQPSQWAAFDSHCPAPDKHTRRKQGGEQGTTVHPRQDRHCVLMGSAAHVNNTLMRHAGTNRIWELSTWMDPN